MCGIQDRAISLKESAKNAACESLGWPQVDSARCVFRFCGALRPALLSMADSRLQLARLRWMSDEFDSEILLNRLHTRVATRLHRVCYKHGGIFTKCGQYLGHQGVLLPPAYEQILSPLVDW
ncbi:MAG: hypothetical protein KVP17_005001 [Porospora cf. gigantea B]|uniref:uncharacterized protein n=1 Tax=Porospora cf. gigantea B TaxID=2853592 RepID=UPI003571C7E1|nr:MAG: hypothetical protein KVP17_005001 [Porospora cf. gigantea B]